MTAAGWKASLSTLLGAMAALAAPPGASASCTSAGTAVALLERWSKELYTPDAPMFRRQFSASEMGRLKKFDAFLAARRDALLATAGEWPPSPAWREVAAEAGNVLKDLGWKDRP